MDNRLVFTYNKMVTRELYLCPWTMLYLCIDVAALVRYWRQIEHKMLVVGLPCYGSGNFATPKIKSQPNKSTHVNSDDQSLPSGKLQGERCEVYFKREEKQIESKAIKNEYKCSDHKATEKKNHREKIDSMKFICTCTVRTKQGTQCINRNINKNYNFVCSLVLDGGPDSSLFV